MSDLVYRNATLDDLPFIVAIIHADTVGVSVEDPQNPGAEAYVSAFAAIEADPNQALYIAEHDGAAIGTFQLTYVPGIARMGLLRAIIEAVHVSPDHRNKGYGKTMIRWAIETARTRGCGLVQLTSNKQRLDAHRFYRTLGFDQSHEGFKLYL